MVLVFDRSNIRWMKYLWVHWMILQSTLIPAMFTLHLESETRSDIEFAASAMPLSPAVLPQGASPVIQDIANSLPFDLLNPEDLDVGHLLEGDIIISPETWSLLRARQLLNSTESQDQIDMEGEQTSRKAIHLDRFFWPKVSGVPTVYYAFASSVKQKYKIRDAIKIWEEVTCINFVEINIGNKNKNHIKFIEGQGCYSYIGMTGQKGQLLSIGERCYQEGIILHEIGHALGLFHEHSRGDRGSYIKVNYTNVRAGSEINFFKETTSNFDVPYDYTSIMHYRSTAFSKNGKSTILTLSPFMQHYLGQRDQLSFRDISIVNKIYECPAISETSCSSSPPTCLNDGYLGKNCTCICPPGTTGNTCDSIIGSYYSLPSCGGNITEAGSIIESPNYPSRYPKDSGCVWWIKTEDECKKPAITVNDFELFTRMGNDQCTLDRLEIRTDSIYDGEEYCGKELNSGTTIEASNQDLILFFSSKLSWGRGFQFSVSFVDACEPELPEATCTITESTSTTLWKSPSYPALYPNNHECQLEFTPENPTRTLVEFTKINLPGNCHDFISISSSHGSVMKICGRKSGRRSLIGSHHYGTFKSDNQVGTQGWALSFVKMESSCHKTIQLTSSSTWGVLTSPNYPQNYPRFAQCEWWIEAPAGRRIQIKFNRLRLSTSAYLPKSKWFRRQYFQKRCDKGFLLVSLQGSKTYSRGANTMKICGYRNNGFKLQSESNKLSLLFYGGKVATSGMKVSYKLI